MLGRFFGRDQKKPGPPKNHIEVVCPVCGAAQYEPRLVVTNFCRKCGEHLRIEKKRVVASSQINPLPSANFPAQSELPPPPIKRIEQPAPAPDPSDFRERRPEIVADKEVADTSTANELALEDLSPELSLGFDKSSEVFDDNPSSTHPAFQKPVLPEAANTAALPTAPMGASTLQKMKDQGYYRQQYFKDVECFDCHNKFKVGRSAKSTNCPTCGAYICLEDFEINMPSSTPILTRGDVLIRKQGNVNTSEIKCRELRVFGAVSANIECSGDLIMRCSGTVIGEIHCKRFVVEKGSDIRFVNTIHAEEVEIQSRVVANILCNGLLTISGAGLIHGDVTASAVSIEPGGQLDGAMNIVRKASAATSPPPAPPV